MLGLIFPPAVILTHCYVRGALVDEIKSDESVCMVCLTATFCANCSAVQMADELVSRGYPARLAMDDLDAYSKRLMDDQLDD